MDLSDLFQAFGQLDSTYQSMGAVGAIALFLTMFVNLYKNQVVQSRLPAALQWDNLSHLEQVAMVFGFSMAGAMVTSLSDHMTMAAALSTGLAAGMASLGLNETTSAAGKVHMQMALSSDPKYQPGTMRKALGIVVPIDQQALNAAQPTPAEAAVLANPTPSTDSTSSAPSAP